MESPVIFRTFKPLKPQLRGIIAYYYLHSAGAEVPEQRFTYYPHYRNAVTCYFNSCLNPQAAGATVVPDSNAGVKCIYSRNYDRSIRVAIRPPFYKLGIAFEPLGIHHFIDKKHSDVALNSIMRFEEFGEEFTGLSEKILNAPLLDPTDLLDDYFCRQMKEPPNLVMIQIVNRLLSETEHTPLESMAAAYGLSLRSLQRKFKSTLVCTPREYRRLIRFRKAINAYQYASREKSFTQLALENNYYDQPAFINHFKKLTGRSPRGFFAHIKQYGSEDIFWTDL